MPTTKITRGSSFLRAVKYDLEQGTDKEDRAKIRSLPATKSEGAIEGFADGARARLLATNVTGDSALKIANEFEKVARQRPGIKEPVHKVSISLKPDEHLETYQWLEVGKSYLEAMGYADAPFLIAQHREKDHEHIHIVTSRVDFNGKVIPDWLEKKTLEPGHGQSRSNTISPPRRRKQKRRD